MLKGKNKIRFQKGHISWNKGMKGYKNKGSFLKGHLPWNTGKGGLYKMPAISKAMKGKKVPHTPEWNRRIGEAKKGKKRLPFSDEWKRKIGKAQKGEKHWNWQGGITPVNLKIRNSIEGKLWQDSVLSKDNFACQKCGEKRIRNLTAHHFQNFSQYIELRTSIGNGITLCRKCHQEFHKIYGRKNNTKEQLDDFFERKMKQQRSQQQRQAEKPFKQTGY